MYSIISQRHDFLNWTSLFNIYLQILLLPGTLLELDNASNSLFICIQLTLEQHKFKFSGSIHTQIFFNKYSTCVFLLGILNLTKCGETLCLIRDHNMWYEKNQGLILSKLFQTPVLEWVIYQFLWFSGTDSLMWQNSVFIDGGLNQLWFKLKLIIHCTLINWVINCENK